MYSTQHLFLYGSWFPGFVHYRWIENFIAEVREARVRGQVYRSSVGFPVFVNEGEDRVPGVIARVSAPESLFLILDEFHGISKMNPGQSAYVKEPVVALTDEGPCPAVVYAVAKARLTRHYPRIVGGDWREDLRRRPDLVSALPEKHKLYLERLRASNGREAVPNDLGLYRELLKMDLIVDRGRRVGLTKLGQDVVRYLPQPQDVRH